MGLWLLHKSFYRLKIIKILLTLILSLMPNAFLIYVASKENDFLAQEEDITNMFRYSFYFMCGYYYLFNSKNNILAYVSKKAARSIKVSNAFCKIIDDAIPALLRMNKNERESVVGAIYHPLVKDEISLPLLLKELKVLGIENTSAYSSYACSKKVFSMLAIIVSVIFMAVDFKVPGYSVISNSQAMILFSTITRLPPYFLMDVLIVNATFNQALTNFYRRECDDIVAYFYPKTSYSIAICSIISFSLFLGFCIKVDTTSDRYKHPTKIGHHYFSDTLCFLEDFLFINMAFNLVCKSLINNYIQIFGEKENKDLFRIVSFLIQIKNILNKAHPDVMDEIFTSSAGDALLINLEIKGRNVSDEKKNSAITFDSISVSHLSFFTEESDFTEPLIEKKMIY